MLRSLRLLTIVAIASSASAQDQWRTDWQQFPAILQTCVSSSSCALSPSTMINGSVTWAGAFRSSITRSSCPLLVVPSTGNCLIVDMPGLPSYTVQGSGSYSISPSVTMFVAPGVDTTTLKAGAPLQFTGNIAVAFQFSYGGHFNALIGIGSAVLNSSGLPTISQNGVVNGASFQPGMVPDSWVTITGTGLSSVTDSWDKAIVNGKLPTSLDGVSVSIGGKPAYIQYISANQINVQAPDVGLGPMPVTVTNANGTSAAATATSQQFGPAFFLWGGKYAAATHVDFSPASKPGLFAGVTTVPAKPGETVVLWGTGFGPANPAVPAGIVVPADRLYPTANPVTVTVGNAGAQVLSAVMSPGYAGLYQIAIQIPSSTPDGDIPIKTSVGGSSSPDNVFITVQH